MGGFPRVRLERLDNFYELQQLAFLNWLMSGDVIATLPVTKRVNMPYDLRICLIEADRLSNPDGDTSDPHIVGGVETNDAGGGCRIPYQQAPPPCPTT